MTWSHSMAFNRMFRERKETSMHNGKEAAITFVLLNSHSSRNYAPPRNARIMESSATPAHGLETLFFGPGFRHRFLEGGS
jgi:hypothetical protein